jgi:hypothetical protein
VEFFLFQKLPLVLRFSEHLSPFLMRRTQRECTSLAWPGVQIPVSKEEIWSRKEPEEIVHNLTAQ